MMKKHCTVYIALGTLFLSIIFIYGNSATTNQQPVGSIEINNDTSVAINDRYIPIDNNLDQPNPLVVPITDEEKAPVQLLPNYKQEDTPRIKLLPSE